MSSYTGFDTLLNIHVVCIRPAVQDIAFVAGGGAEQIDSLYLTGSVSIGSSVPPGLTFYNWSGLNNIPDPSNYVNCIYSFAKNLRSTATDWPISICIAENYLGNTVSQALKASEMLPQLGADGSSSALADRGLLEQKYSSAALSRFSSLR